MSETGISSKLLKMKFMQKLAKPIPREKKDDHKGSLPFFKSVRENDASSSQSSDNEQELQVLTFKANALMAKKTYGGTPKIILTASTS